MKNAVHYDVVPAFGVDGGGGQNVQDGGGAGLQLGEVGLLLAHDQAFEGKLLVLFFDRRFFFFAVFAGGFAAFFCIVSLLLNIRPRLSGLEPDRVI